MSRSSCLLHACAVDAMHGNPDVGNFPACGSPGLVTPGLSRRRAYRRAYVASPRLTTTDVGLTPRLAYARVVHTAPGGMGTRVNIFILVPILIGGRPTWLCETIHSSDIHTLCIGDLHNLFVADSITSLSTKYVSCSSWMTFSLNRSINLRDLHVVVFFYANEKMILMMIMNLSITACLFSWAKLN